MTERQAPTLLPCPFCGEQMREVIDHVGTWYAHAKLDGPCFASVCQIMPGEVEAWNRRAALAMPKLIFEPGDEATAPIHDPFAPKG